MSLTKWHNHWPRGIPSSIRRHEEPVEDVESASRAWRFFVREQWVDGAAVDEQRRALVERWAIADQDFRDVCFHLERIFILYLHRDRAMNLEHWRMNLSLKTPKMYEIPLYHLTCDSDLDDMSMLLPIEDNQGDILEIFKFRLSVARPDFLDTYMTLDGTVLFTECEPKLIIDDRTLETGLGLWVQFKTNGTRERAYRTQMAMEEFPDLFRDIHSNMNTLENALQYMEGDKDPDPEEILEDEP